MTFFFFIQSQLYHCSLCKANQIKYLSTLPGNPRKDFKIPKQITIALCLFIREKKSYSFLCESWEPELQMQPRCRIMALSICPSNEGLFLDLGSVCCGWQYQNIATNTHKHVLELCSTACPPASLKRQPTKRSKMSTACAGRFQLILQFIDWSDLQEIFVP